MMSSTEEGECSEVTEFIQHRIVACASTLLGQIVMSKCSAKVAVIPGPAESIDTVAKTIALPIDGYPVRSKAGSAALYQLVNAKLTSYLDIRFAVQLVLGRHLRMATPRERNEFVADVAKILRIDGTHIAARKTMNTTLAALFRNMDLWCHA